MINEISAEKLEYNRKFQYLCKKPFYGHPHGCPNYGKKTTCPPNVPLIDKVLDLGKPSHLIFTEFNVGEFAEKIRKSHPAWKSPRQWYNPRYWQPMARKLQRHEESLAKQNLGLELIINNPEALGVNVTKLMASTGISLDWHWPPLHEDFMHNKVYLVSLGGYSRK